MAPGVVERLGRELQSTHPLAPSRRKGDSGKGVNRARHRMTRLRVAISYPSPSVWKGIRAGCRSSGYAGVGLIGVGGVRLTLKMESG
jgi:hypothetical protein